MYSRMLFLPDTTTKSIVLMCEQSSVMPAPLTTVNTACSTLGCTHPEWGTMGTPNLAARRSTLRISFMPERRSASS